MLSRQESPQIGSSDADHNRVSESQRDIDPDGGTDDTAEFEADVLVETDIAPAPAEEEVDRRGFPTDEPEIPVRELLDTLNEAFQVEIDRKKALIAGLPTVSDADAGVRFARGLFLAGGIGVATWGLILVVILMLT